MSESRGLRPLLMVLNPRDIAECMESFHALTVPRAFLTGFTERNLIGIIRDLIATTDYTHYVAVSDDTIVRERAVQAVYDQLEHYPVVTGWCNLDGEDARCNVVDRPLEGTPPTKHSYGFMHWTRVVMHPEPAFRTWFAGMCLTGMTREMWQRFPFDVLPGSINGWCSDYSLSWRLQEADVPIMAVRDGYAFHVKTAWMTSETDPRKQTRVGSVPAVVTVVT